MYRLPKRPEIILVSGSPRGGTTPIGAILTMIPGAQSLYEPMGETGDRRFSQRFPMPGTDDFQTSDLTRFVDDICARKLSFKPQVRKAHNWKQRLISRILGTRTLASYRLLKLRRNASPIIWKDPQAVFCAPFGATAGFRSIVTIRSPHAHAASFKRLGWVSNVPEIYAAYAQVFGKDADIERHISEVGDTPLGSAAILWRMIYTPLVDHPPQSDDLFLLNFETHATDEAKNYTRLFEWLGHPVPVKVLALINKRQDLSGAGQPQTGKVHDFNRSATAANSYWQDVLQASEIDLVNQINGPLWETLRSR